MKNRIKAPNQTNGPRFKANNPSNYDEKCIVFSLEKLCNGKHCFSKLTRIDKSKFADAIFKRKNQTWKELKNMDKHALGYEQIKKTSIKKHIPSFITDEHKYFLAFRYNKKKPMVGYRLKEKFFVLWFDHDFKVYDH